MSDAYYRYRRARAMSRFWWHRHNTLPRWRYRARREAEDLARLWGVIAKQAHEIDASNR